MQVLYSTPTCGMIVLENLRELNMHNLMLPYYKALATAREVLADNLTYRADRAIDLTLALRDLLEALDMLPDGLSNAITESNAFYALNIEDCIKIIREQLTVEYNGECSYAGALDTLNFYRKRCELLQQVQARMRDPERTLVCDILANGQLLGSVDGPRYSPPTAVPAEGLRDSALNSAKFRASCYALVGIVEGIEGIGRRWATNGERLKDTREWVAFYNSVAAMRNGTTEAPPAAVPEGWRELLSKVPLPPNAITFDKGWELLDELQRLAVLAAAREGE